jgi:hypothetical protein
MQEEPPEAVTYWLALEEHRAAERERQQRSYG